MLRTSRGLVVAGVVVAGALLGSWPAAASCASIVDADSADVVFEAEALDGQSTPDGSLISPADLRVLRYLRGTGPERVRIRTNVISWDGTHVGGTSTGIGPRVGETWRIYVRHQDLTGVVDAGCTASERIAEGPDAAAAHDAGPVASEPSGPSTAWVVAALLAVLPGAGVGLARWRSARNR